MDTGYNSRIRDARGIPYQPASLTMVINPQVHRVSFLTMRIMRTEFIPFLDYIPSED